MNDIASALTQSLSKDGQTTPTGNLPMGSNRHTGVGNAAARSDYAAAGQVQDSAFLWCGTAGGSANALTLSPSPAITAYAAGQTFRFKSSSNANTSTTTVAISGLATQAIQNNGAALAGGEIAASQWYEILYDGAAFQLLNLSVSASAPFVDTNPVVQGSADATKKLRFEVDGFSTATTRVATPANYDLRIGNIPAGVIMDYAGSSVPTGWLECDGSAVSRTTYADLFTAVSTTWGAGDGSTTFNLPDFRGRARIGRGTGTATAAGSNADVDTTNDTLTVASNTDKWITGMPVVFTLTSGTVTGLTSGVTYYIVRNNTTTVKLASSLANAQNGTVIDMTAKSSPVWTIAYALTARTLADQGGEQAHAMSLTELLSHNHPDIFTNPGGAGISYNGNGGGTDADFVQARGGNAAMNIMQPYATVMTIISY